MAKKQNDYLAGLLAEDAGQAPGAPSGDTSLPSPPAPAPAVARAGMSLLGRENALARVASGEVRQVTQLLLDPARVRVWPGNARAQDRLSESAVRDLIDSILAEGGQKVPVVVRRLVGDAEADYELVAGTRRHFAISWLRANSYPQFRLLAQVAEIDDESAFRLADLENRARADISDIERARNYLDAVDRHYGGRAVRMAERLNLSKGWLSKMLKAAAIPDAVLAAFADWHELTLTSAYRLALALDDPARAAAITAEAERVVADNAAAAARGEPAAGGVAVLARLLAARDNPPPPTKSYRMDFTGSRGRTILEVKGVTRQGITLHVPLASGASDEQVAQAVKKALDTLRLNGVTLR